MKPTLIFRCAMALLLTHATLATAADPILTFPESDEESEPVPEDLTPDWVNTPVRYSPGVLTLGIWGIYANYSPQTSGILNYRPGPWTGDPSTTPTTSNPITPFFGGTYTGPAGPRITHNMTMVVYPGQAVTLAGANLTNQPIYVTSWVDVLSKNTSGLTTKNFRLTDSTVTFNVPTDASTGEAEIRVWARVFQLPYYNDYYKISAPLKLYVVPKPTAPAIKYELRFKPIAPAAKKFFPEVGRNIFVVNGTRAQPNEKDRIRFSVPAEDPESEQCLQAARDAVPVGKVLVITGWYTKKTETSVSGTLRTFNYVRGTGIDPYGGDSRLISCKVE